MEYEIGDVIYRQGDVLLKKTTHQRCDSIPPYGEAIIVQGQQHSHTLRGEFLVHEKDGKRLLSVYNTSTLDHPEHGPIEISANPTCFEISQQVEFDHWTEESREVID